MSTTNLLSVSFNALTSGFTSLPMAAFESMGVTSVRFEFELLASDTEGMGPTEHVEGRASRGAITATVDLLPTRRYRVRTVAFTPDYPNGLPSEWVEFGTGVTVDTTFRSFMVVEVDTESTASTEPVKSIVPYGYLAIQGATIRVTGHDTPPEGISVVTNQNGFAVVSELEKDRLYKATTFHASYEARSIYFTASSTGTTLIVLVPTGEVYLGSVKTYDVTGVTETNYLTLADNGSVGTVVVKSGDEGWFLKSFAWGQPDEAWFTMEYSADNMTWSALEVGSTPLKVTNGYIRLTATVATPGDRMAHLNLETPSGAKTTLYVNVAEPAAQ